MLCDACKLKEAVIHRITIINGKKHSVALCADCAKKSMMAGNSLPSLMEMLFDFNAAASASDETAVCRNCGTSMDSFKKNGLLGCSKCYEYLNAELLPVIKRTQNGHTQHIGRAPKFSSGPEVSITQLRNALNAAIQREEYEQAAILRDRIRELQEGESHGK